MRPEAVEYFRCVKCRSLRPLKVNRGIATNSNEIIEAQLECATCGTFYPVKGGIPYFGSEDNYAETFGFQWNIHSKTQLDSYTGLPVSRKRLYGITGWPQRMEGLKVLEVGSGAGRFTEILTQTGAIIFSFDISSSVCINYANNGSCPQLHIFQGDIFNIPLRKRSFDKVICLGVIQHTPDPAKAFRCLTEFVCPGGELVMDVYAKGLINVLCWKYILRPITKRMNKMFLYNIVSRTVPVLLPLAIFLRRFFGRFGARLLPIVEYSNLGLSYELNKENAILDTFDIYSPKYDKPQTLWTVKQWFVKAGFTNVVVGYGPNGVIGKGCFPAGSIHIC